MWPVHKILTAFIMFILHALAWQDSASIPLLQKEKYNPEICAQPRQNCLFVWLLLKSGACESGALSIQV